MGFARIWKARRAASVAALTAVALVGALGVSQRSASAQAVTGPDYWRGTQERRDTLYRFVYRQSPQAIPSGYSSVAEAERITLTEAQRSLPASNPQVRSLWARIRAITIESGLSTAPRALGSISLAVGVFEIGWRIGSGINAKFLRLGVPEEIPHTETDFRGNGRRQELVWHAAGHNPFAGRIIQPIDAFTWRRHTDSGFYDYWQTGTPERNCDMPRVAPPAGVTVVTTPFATATCYGIERLTDYHLGYVTEDDFGAPGPIEDYTGQPYDRSTGVPPAPPQTTVEQAIDTELDKPENELLRDWLNYQLGSPGQTDPVTGDVNVPQPDVAPGESGEDFVNDLDELGLTNIKIRILSTPDLDAAFAEGAVVSVSPSPGTSVEPDDEVEVTINRTAQRPNNGECDRSSRIDPGVPPSGDEFELTDTFLGRDPDQGMAATDVPFRWGTEGWGFRHVAIGHGWDHGDDRSDTQAALLDPTPEADQPGSHRFYFFYVGPNRTPCTRRVVARFATLSGEPGERGIITSFAHPGWYRRSDFN
jgi:hypothetical protein